MSVPGHIDIALMSSEAGPVGAGQERRFARAVHLHHPVEDQASILPAPFEQLDRVGAACEGVVDELSGADQVRGFDAAFGQPPPFGQIVGEVGDRTRTCSPANARRSGGRHSCSTRLKANVYSIGNRASTGRPNQAWR